MNEKILEIAATIPDLKLWGVTSGDNFSEAVELFGESLINRCVDIANSHFESREPGYPGDKIAEYFGLSK